MAGKYKLLAGQHVQADPDAPDPKPRADGTVPKKPSKTYNAGDVVESDDDLVAKHGTQKFAKVGESARSRRAKFAEVGTSAGDPAPDQVKENPGVFPHGQVSTGLQEQGGQGTVVDVTKFHDPATQLASGDKGKVKGERGSEDDAGGETESASAPAASPADEDPAYFDAMTVVELREYAEENEVDLRGAVRKDDIVKRLKESRGR
jgi:hypothetical protein